MPAASRWVVTTFLPRTMCCNSIALFSRPTVRAGDVMADAAQLVPDRARALLAPASITGCLDRSHAQTILPGLVRCQILIRSVSTQVSPVCWAASCSACWYQARRLSGEHPGFTRNRPAGGRVAGKVGPVLSKKPITAYATPGRIGGGEYRLWHRTEPLSALRSDKHGGFKCSHG